MCQGLLPTAAISKNEKTLGTRLGALSTIIRCNSCSEELSRFDKTNNSFYCLLVLLFLLFLVLLYLRQVLSHDINVYTCSHTKRLNESETTGYFHLKTLTSIINVKVSCSLCTLMSMFVFT